MPLLLALRVKLIEACPLSGSLVALAESENYSPPLLLRAIIFLVVVVDNFSSVEQSERHTASEQGEEFSFLRPKSGKSVTQSSWRVLRFLPLSATYTSLSLFIFPAFFYSSSRVTLPGFPPTYVYEALTHTEHILQLLSPCSAQSPRFIHCPAYSGDCDTRDLHSKLSNAGTTGEKKTSWKKIKGLCASLSLAFSSSSLERCESESFTLSGWPSKKATFSNRPLLFSQPERI